MAGLAIDTTVPSRPTMTTPNATVTRVPKPPVASSTGGSISAPVRTHSHYEHRLPLRPRALLWPHRSGHDYPRGFRFGGLVGSPVARRRCSDGPAPAPPGATCDPIFDLPPLIHNG